MMDPDLRDTCSKMCLPNCEEIEYSYQVDTTNLDIDKLCSEEDTRNVRSKIIIMN